jgi:hypothetical protein
MIARLSSSPKPPFHFSKVKPSINFSILEIKTSSPSEVIKTLLTRTSETGIFTVFAVWDMVD